MSNTVEIKNQADEKALVEKAKGGDEHAFMELVRMHKDTIFRLALRILNDRDEAEDAAQEAFIKAYRSIGSFRSEALFRTWLYRITINVVRNIKKARRKVVPLEEEIVHKDNPLVLIQSREEQRELEGFIAQLPFRQRTAVVLRIQQGLGFKDVAESMGCTKGGARSHYFQGIQNLRRYLKKQ